MPDVQHVPVECDFQIAVLMDRGECKKQKKITGNMQ
jgi:hypothetical protein